MKLKQIILASLLLSSLHIFAQHPLVGTWELVSMKGINDNGKSFSPDASMLKVIKIITPTHYIQIAHNVKGDSLVFRRSHAGSVILDGNRYIEIIKISSWDNHKTGKLNFIWKVEGDKLIKSGSITYEDGTTLMYEEMVFKRIKSKNSYPDNPSNGTWDQLSSSYTLADGKKESHTRETATRFHIVTPTHWMRISHRNNKFESAMGGTYTMEGNKVYPLLEFASYLVTPGGKYELTERIEGDKLYVSGVSLRKNGSRFIWDDVFQKVGTEVLK